METYIFLDVDGVLNNRRHYKKQHDKYGGRFFCENMPFNPKSLKNLRKIVDKTGAKIILTSSWRRSENCMIVLEARLIEYGLKVFSKTEHINGNRGQEIIKWLRDNAPQTQTTLYFNNELNKVVIPDYNFVIIDDEKYDIEEHFDSMDCVWCNWEKGLNTLKTYEAINKLLWQKEVMRSCPKF